MKQIIHNQEPRDDEQRRELEAEFQAALLVVFRSIYEGNEPRNEAEAMLLPMTLSAGINDAAPTLHKWLEEAARFGIETGLDEYGESAFVNVEGAASDIATERLQVLLPQLQRATLTKSRFELFGANEKGLSLAALYASVEGLFSLSRAKLISTTETTFAFNLALSRLGGWLTGINAQQWIARHDGRVCPMCSALSGSIWIDGEPTAGGSEYTFGQPVRLGAPFVHPGGTGAQARFSGRRFERPPAHPGCRCRLRLLRISHW